MEKNISKNNLVKGLLALAIFQVLLIVFLGVYQAPLEVGLKNKSLIEFDSELLESIALSDQEKSLQMTRKTSIAQTSVLETSVAETSDKDTSEPLTLNPKLSAIFNSAYTQSLFRDNSEAWVVTLGSADLQGLPASASKIEKLLKDLEDLKVSQPVTTSENSSKKLLTSEDAFGKKIVLKFPGQATKTIFFGDTPSFKSIYARTGKDDQTFLVNYDESSLSMIAKNWLDRELLHLNSEVLKNSLVDIAYNDFKIRVEQADNQKTLQIYGVSDNDENLTRELNAEEFRSFIKKITNINYAKQILKELPSWGKMEQAGKIVLSLKGDDNVDGEIKLNFDLRINKSKNEKGSDKYYLKASFLPYFFEISKFTFDSISVFTLERLSQNS